MKVILSRKGFDSGSGGQPSPILPDGTLLSLPIPIKNDNVKYADLYYGDKSYLEIIGELNPKNQTIGSHSTAHLDPDIRFDCHRDRASDWKPIFGQAEAAQGHLRNQGVTEGDLFLFFGWFRQTEEVGGKLRYKKGSPHQHIIFGYLQIDEIISDEREFPDYALNHSHCCGNNLNLRSNCIYIAKQNLTFKPGLCGAGTFQYSKDLVLTKDGMTRGNWELPEFFKELNISYHTQDSFKEGYFKNVNRGQEFVIQADDKLADWVCDLFDRKLA